MTERVYVDREGHRIPNEKIQYVQLVSVKKASCIRCHMRLPDESVDNGLCDKCMELVKHKEPVNVLTVGLLSVIPGLGHFYLKDYRKGATHLLWIPTLCLLGLSLLPLLGLFLAFMMYSFSIIDAIKNAQMINRVLRDNHAGH